MRATELQFGITPQALVDKPVLKPWLLDLYIAFGQLSSSRPVSMGGLGAIPLSEILAYLQLYGIDDFDDRETFVRMVQAIDSSYLKLVRMKQESSSAA